MRSTDGISFRMAGVVLSFLCSVMCVGQMVWDFMENIFHKTIWILIGKTSHKDTTIRDQTNNHEGILPKALDIKVYLMEIQRQQTISDTHFQALFLLLQLTLDTLQFPKLKDRYRRKFIELTFSLGDQIFCQRLMALTHQS